MMAFIAALETRTPIPIATEGERLSSREAESRLAVTERDWRKRKANLDAAAALLDADRPSRRHSTTAIRHFLGE